MSPTTQDDITIFLSRVLPRVSKPGRYIGGEVNTPRATPTPDDIRVCLAFPEVYEIGMSHQGMAILLSILNRTDGVFAERAFSPWPDMEAEMCGAGIPLFSLETRTPLTEFDIIGVSLMYELTYTNVVRLLMMAGIPVHACDRDGRFPLVIAGGSCAFNPEPVAEVFDAIVIGDGEEEICRIVTEYREAKTLSREKLLYRLAGIEGVYVPRFYEPQYQDGTFSGMRYLHDGTGVVKKCTARDINRLPYPTAPVIPNIEAVHDRVSVEIARGCGHGCRFCQAGFIYRPVRERDEETVARLVKKQVRATGMEEVSLLSLSSGDYNAVGPLMRRLMGCLEQERVALSVPSLRVDTLTDEMIQEIKKVRKTGFTIAPEAGSDRLRAAINKNITESDIEATVERVFSAGWRLIKLYFMIGLPTEVDEDLTALIALVKKIEHKIRGGGRGSLNVSISTFVPKPHTPFQWEAAIDIREIERRQSMIRGALRSPRIALKFHDPRVTTIEAVFSRGDRRLLPVIIAAAKIGCRFDGWTEHFRFDLWRQAFEETGLSMERYATAPIEIDAPLPWDHIDTGVRRDFFVSERERAYREQPTTGCLADECAGCGVCVGDIEIIRAKVVPARLNETGEGQMGPSSRPAGIPKDSDRIPCRLIYSRSGFVSFLSHLETMQAITRALARAAVPVNFTEGFHPKPRISFSGALPVGVQARGEPFTVELSQAVDAKELATSLNRTLPEGLTVSPAPIDGVTDEGRPVYTAQLPQKNGHTGKDIDDLILSFLSHTECWFLGEVGGQKKRIDVRPYVERASFFPEQERLVIEMKRINGSSPSPYRVISVMLGIPEREARSLSVIKQSVVLTDE